MASDLNGEAIALPAAAAAAFREVYSTHPDRNAPPSNDELDLVALALSIRLPIYGVRFPGNKPARLSEPELLEGMFWGGAARFESRHQAGPVSQLMVCKPDFERVLRELHLLHEREDV